MTMMMKLNITDLLHFKRETLTAGPGGPLAPIPPGRPSFPWKHDHENFQLLQTSLLLNSSLCSLYFDAYFHQ